MKKYTALLVLVLILGLSQLTFAGPKFGVGGVLGFDALFITQPRRAQLLLPFLGIAIGDEVHILADIKYLQGGEIRN